MTTTAKRLVLEALSSHAEGLSILELMRHTSLSRKQVGRVLYNTNYTHPGCVQRRRGVYMSEWRLVRRIEFPPPQANAQDKLLLQVLKAHPTGLTGVQLRARLGISRSLLSLRMRRLLKRGLVARHPLGTQRHSVLWRAIIF